MPFGIRAGRWPTSCFAAALAGVALGSLFRGVATWALVGLLCVYTMFLLALSSIALSILLTLGPFFITLLLFDATRRFFDAWLAQLANYALITILTVTVSALLLQLVATYAQQTAALGTSIRIDDALDMLLATVLVFLFLRQIMPIAAALAGGAALSSMGTVSRTIRVPVRAALTSLAVLGGG
jgi:type IV secretion system protein VirB6